MTDSTQPVAGPAEVRGFGFWRWLMPWVLLVVGLSVAWASNTRAMWFRWFPRWRLWNAPLYDRLFEGESYYTHAPLVPLVSLLIAVMLIRHTRIRLRPRPLAGSAVIAIGLLGQLVSTYARVTFTGGFSLIIVLVGLVLLVWGFEALRRLWFPLALLLFMVPLPEVTISGVNFRLKIVASQLGVGIVDFLGVIVERTGNEVFLEGDKRLVVANVCNGLRTLISLIAFGAIYAYVARVRGAWRLGLFAMAIPVALVANALRVVMLILAAHIWTVDLATGWFHDFTGLLIYVLAFLLMFGVERAILGARKMVGRPAEVLPLFPDVRRTEEDADQSSRMFRAAHSRRVYGVLGGMGLVAVVVVLLTRSVPAAYSGEVVANALPTRIAVGEVEYVGLRREIDRRSLAILETEDYAYMQYLAPGRLPVDFCVIFSQDNRKGTHPPEVCLEGGGWEVVHLADVPLGVVGDLGDLTAREVVTQQGGARQYYLYIYKCGHSYTSSFWTQQVLIFFNGLLNRDASGALVRVSMGMDAGLEASREQSAAMMRAALPLVQHAMDASGE